VKKNATNFIPIIILTILQEQVQEGMCAAS